MRRERERVESTKYGKNCKQEVKQKKEEEQTIVKLAEIEKKRLKRTKNGRQIEFRQEREKSVNKQHTDKLR